MTEPSNFALSLSERIMEGEAFELTEAERGKLSPYERRVLQRTAEKQDYIFEINIDTGVIILRRRP